MIQGPSNIKTIILFYDHTFALDNDGGVWAWGNNEKNILGIGLRIKQSGPVKIQGLEPKDSIVGRKIFSALSEAYLISRLFVLPNSLNQVAFL